MSSHPLSDVELRFADFKGFGERHTGFDAFAPINVIIGRNNSGKSALIDGIELCASRGSTFVPLKHGHKGKPFQVFVTQTLDERSLRQVFHENTAGGVIGVNHWAYAAPYVGRRRVTRKFQAGWGAEFTEDLFPETRGHQFVPNLLKAMHWPFEGVKVIRLAAERDVVPELRVPGRTVDSNGTGTTNLVRAFLLNDSLPRAEVEVGLLSDLNEIYEGDCHFSQILVRQDGDNDTWEIFLREEEKGDVRLSQSGSSLKSIFILLAMMRLEPYIHNCVWSQVVLAVEEPENNLHPALLRRLLNFLATERARLGCTLVITTHSPVCIDWATKRSDTQILHVQRKSEQSEVRTAIGYRHSTDILDDLDVRASDILQSNGIIWVEGPSDRIYLKRWLDIATNGELVEGVHFTTMLYGGRLLNHFDALAPNEDSELISLMSINRNAALLMDSDRHHGLGKTKTGRSRKPRMKINDTKLRIKQELEVIGGLVWITEGREVENYVSRRILEKLAGRSVNRADMYEDVLAMREFSSYRENKITFAHDVAKETAIIDLKCNLDLETRVLELAKRIRSWNAMPDLGGP